MLFEEFINEKSSWDKIREKSKEMFGEWVIDALSEDELAQLIDVPAADKIARKVFKEYSFTDLTLDEMGDLINKYPSVVKESLDEAIYVDTRGYKGSHGKEPKGFGAWAFYFDKKDRDVFFTPTSMSYGDAIKWAKEQAKVAGKSIIYVGESLDEAMYIDTTGYKGSHGKEPKGTGIWAFYFNKKDRDVFFTPTSMSYGDAVKWAKEQAKVAGKSIIYVGESLNEDFPGPGETVNAKDLDYDMLDYFNRTNKKLLINTKTKKGIEGSVGKMYGDLVFNGDDINIKDIVSVKILESKGIFPDQVEGNDQLIFKKVKEWMNGGTLSGKYDIYYKGYPIDEMRTFGSVEALQGFIKNYILSNNLYNEYKNKPAKQIGESMVNESDSLMAFILIAQAAAIGGQIGMMVAKQAGANSPIEDLKRWWNNRKRDKAVQSIVAKLQSDPDIIEFMKLTPSQQKGKFRVLVATKLSPEESDYLNRINKSHFQTESLDEATTSWSKMMKGVKSSESGPWSLVAIENKKVIGQKIDIRIKEMLPAEYEALHTQYPNAKIHIEDGTGQVVWTN